MLLRVLATLRQKSDCCHWTMEAIGDYDCYSLRGMIGPGDSIGKVEERGSGDQVMTESTVSNLDKLCCGK